jgi:hypothetical protein
MSYFPNLASDYGLPNLFIATSVFSNTYIIIFKKTHEKNQQNKQTKKRQTNKKTKKKPNKQNQK